MARTGSGKTAAFVIPMVEKLKAHSPRAGARTVILSPTTRACAAGAAAPARPGLPAPPLLRLLCGCSRMATQCRPRHRRRHAVLYTPPPPPVGPAPHFPTPCCVPQTHKVVKELGRHTDLRTAVLVGGDSMEAQFAELAAFPDILVATPGAPVCRAAGGGACRGAAAGAATTRLLLAARRRPRLGALTPAARPSPPACRPRPQAG